MQIKINFLRFFHPRHPSCAPLMWQKWGLNFIKRSNIFDKANYKRVILLLCLLWEKLISLFWALGVPGEGHDKIHLVTFSVILDETHKNKRTKITFTTYVHILHTVQRTYIALDVSVNRLHSSTENWNKQSSHNELNKVNGYALEDRNSIPGRFREFHVRHDV